MGKYEPLSRYLSEIPRNEWDAKFTEIEQVLKTSLPPSARTHKSWWGNSTRGNHVQSKGWIDAGWLVKEVDLPQQKVRLERSAQKGRSEATAELNELWKRASELSGITDKTELERAAVSNFIRREAGRQLAALGGTMPDAKAPPRRRVTW